MSIFRSRPNDPPPPMPTKADTVDEEYTPEQQEFRKQVFLIALPKVMEMAWSSGEGDDKKFLTTPRDKADIAWVIADAAVEKL